MISEIIATLFDAVDTVRPTAWVIIYGLWLAGSVVFILGQRRRPVATLAWLLAFVSRSVQLLFDGDPTYAAIEAAMSDARHHLHLEYYIYEPDAVGLRWREILIRKAGAGVQVRVLVDALGSKNCTTAFWQPLRDAGGEVRLFNPLRVLRLNAGLMNFRSHRKIVVIDGVLSFTGGINVAAGSSAAAGSSSASNDPSGAGWRDTHLRIDGAPTLDLQMVFLEDWLFAGVHRPDQAHADRLLLEDPECIAAWFSTIDQGKGPWVQIIDSGSDEPVPEIHRFFFAAITGARKRLWITTPYFVPDEPIMTALTTAAARGVDVRLIVPRDGDSKLVSAAASTFVDEAVAEGVRAWEYLPRMIHAKTMIVDDELALVGSANLDNRSFRLNFEVMAAIYDRDTAARLAECFLVDLRNAREVKHGGRGSFGTRLLASAARLFAPLL